MEQHLQSDRPGVARHGSRLGKRLAPYLLISPGGLWLGIFFLVPMLAMLSLSLQTGSIDTGFRQTWNFGVYPHAIGEYHKYFLRSLLYGGVASAATLLISYPMSYWIAFHGGRRKTTYLLLLLLPFFVSFVIRTLAWGFILSDEGILFGTLKSWHLLPSSFRVLNTGTAVVSGIAYNFLPFMALPLYVTLEKIDRSVVAAAGDLYASKRETFLRVILPLSVPGIFAGVLLTLVPAVGDYVNASILGGTENHMIGNIIQTEYLYNFNYPLAAALSFVLMAGMVIGILAYARVLGTREIEEYV